MRSYHNTTGAGCSLKANTRQKPGSAVALPCKHGGCSVAPAPIERRQTDRQTNRQGSRKSRKPIPSPGYAPSVGGLPGRPPCRAGWGAVCPRAGAGAPCRFAPNIARRLALGLSIPLCAPVPSAVRRVLKTTPPAVRLRGCASRSALAKRLQAHRVEFAPVAFVSGLAGLFDPGLPRALSPFYIEGVIV